jgi:hypothetical protein
MKNLDAMGIFSYYQRLPYGEKEKFKLHIAEAIGKSYPCVCQKISGGKWNEKTELPIVNRLIEEENGVREN